VIADAKEIACNAVPLPKEDRATFEVPKLSCVAAGRGPNGQPHVWVVPSDLDELALDLMDLAGIERH
jgi:hypothetical protein